MKVSLIKSLIGRTKRQRACVRGLGLKKINSSQVLPQTPEILGMIRKVNFMLKVEQINE